MTDIVTYDPAILTEVAAIQELAAGALGFAAVRAAVRTRLFDHLDDDGTSVDGLAARAGLDPLAVRRVLRYLETRGLATLDGDVVRPTARSAHYRTDSPLWPSLAHRGSADVAHAMDHCLRTGRSAWQHVHGVTFFDFLTADPDQEAIFAESMRNEGVVGNLVAVPHIDLTSVRVVADIGGGTGDLLDALLRANPDARGILVDLPGVLARAHVDRARCELCAGDLFGPMPAADAYVLARILHDWSDDDGARILRHIREAAAPGARLFDLDLVVPDGDGWHPSKLSDLGMMLLFGGGRERTRAEFAELFSATGWRLDEIVELPMSSLLRATAV